MVMKVNAPAPLSAADIVHRRQFEQFVLDDAAPWHREHLGDIYNFWNNWNDEFFDAEMLSPYIVLSAPSSPRAEGDCAAVSGFGGRSQIRIRPSLLTGTYPRLRRGHTAEGRRLYVLDVLLHEMIHQWQQEVTGIVERSYHGHGPSFRDKCNEIDAKLGLPPVGLKTRRGTLTLPNCAHWPSNVRPTGYYLGAMEEPREVVTVEPSRGGLADAGPLPEAPGSPLSRTAMIALIARVALRVLNPPELDELMVLLENGRKAKGHSIGWLPPHGPDEKNGRVAALL